MFLTRHRLLSPSHSFRNKATKITLTEDEIKAKREARREKQKEYDRISREKNKEARRERQKKYYSENKETISERKRQYQTENRELLREKQKQYYNENRATILAQQRELRAPKGEQKKSWKTTEELRHNLEEIAETLLVKQDSDWYRVSKTQIVGIGYATLIHRYKSLGAALQLAYPEKEWDLKMFRRIDKRAVQKWISTLLAEMLPAGTTIIEDEYYVTSSLPSVKLQIDLYVPEFKFGIEYQGEQHFAYVKGRGDLERRMAKDQTKKERFEEDGNTLIQIPYWWNGRKGPLYATFHSIRPDMFPRVESSSNPIPLEPPTPHRNKVFSYEEKDDRIKKAIMHGRDWENKKFNPTGWIITEKFDGARGFWDGEKLYTREGNPLKIPESFRCMFPSGVTLDGEVWVGYGKFSELSSILMKTQFVKDEVLPEDLAGSWKSVQYIAFDAPDQEGNYSKRNSYLKTLIDPNNPSLSVSPMQVCLDEDHLRNEFDKVKERGGEGLMIYDPVAEYTPGRGSLVLKVKAELETSRVKFKKLSRSTKSAAYLCTQENGVDCLIPCCEHDFKNPPKVGTTLLVLHNGFIEKSKKLKAPRYMRPEIE